MECGDGIRFELNETLLEIMQDKIVRKIVQRRKPVIVEKVREVPKIVIEVQKVQKVVEVPVTKHVEQIGSEALGWNLRPFWQLRARREVSRRHYQA